MKNRKCEFVSQWYNDTAAIQEFVSQMDNLQKAHQHHIRMVKIKHWCHIHPVIVYELYEYTVTNKKLVFGCSHD